MTIYKNEFNRIIMTKSSGKSRAGLIPGKKVDIRVLEAIAQKGEVRIILYFEEDLARVSTYSQDLVTYTAPEHERPFIECVSFLKFQREMNPSFDSALTMVPLLITIISIDEEYDGKPVVKGVLPFLDEMDLT